MSREEIAIKINKDDENENILSTNEKTVEEQKLIDKPSHLVDKFLSNSINNSSKQINNNKLFERIDTNFLSSAFGSVTTIKSIGNKQSTNARTVLWYLVFLGFAVNYMLRININIAIVDMNSVKKTTNNNHHRSECFANVDHINIGDANANGTVLSLLKTNLTESKKYLISELGPNEITYSTEQSILNYFDIDFNSNGINWNELQQSRVLGAYFWLHWILQIPGGILAQRYGTKLIFGVANFISSVMCFLMPIAAYWDVSILITLRIIQGCIAGLQWPAMHHMTAQWIPPDERSKFVTSYLGSSVGIAVFYPIFGYIISTLSWQWVFYVSGIFGSLWYIGWLYFVFDTPMKHPRIDPLELLYIEKSLGETVNRNKKALAPWSQILRSRPVWINIIAQWGGIWGLFTLMTQGPTYFRIIHGWNVQMVGILSGVPHLLRMIFAYFFSTLCDSLLRNNKLSRTNVRKLAGAMCTIVKGVFVLALAFSGCNTMAAVIFVTLATTFHGAVSTGPLASIIDISPNYSGVILGLTGMIAVVPGFISPYIVGKLTFGNQTVQQWQYVFLIAAGMLFSCGIVYVCFAESNLQSWNQPEVKKSNKKMKKETEKSSKIIATEKDAKQPETKDQRNNI